MEPFLFRIDGHIVHVSSRLPGLTPIRIVLSDLGIDCTYFDFETDIPCIEDEGVSIWIGAFHSALLERLRLEEDFPGLRCKILNKYGKVLAWKDFPTGKNPKIPVASYITDPLDTNGASYADFFYSDLLDGMDFSGVVIDAGANTGFFTLKSLCEGAHRVYLIEPDPSPFYYSQRNFSQNSKVVLINKALSSSDEPLCLWMSPNDSVGNSEFGVRNQTEGHVQTKVESIRLSTILALESRISLLKLDIEGTEYEVLRGLDKSEFDKVGQWFIEFHNGVCDIIQILEEAGYTCSLRYCQPDWEVGFIWARR